MNTNRPADWLEFWVRFVCGGLLGGLVGFSLWQDVFPPAPYAWLALPVGCVFFGLAATWFGDRFWYSLKPWLGW